MISAKTAPLAGSPEYLQWRMPTSPLDYPDRNPVLSEEERRGIEHLLSLSSWQWRAFEQQLVRLSRITKPLLDVIMLFQQRRPTSMVSRKRFIDHLLGHVLQTNTVYWGWSSGVWDWSNLSRVSSTSVLRPRPTVAAPPARSAPSCCRGMDFITPAWCTTIGWPTAFRCGWCCASGSIGCTSRRGRGPCRCRSPGAATGSPTRPVRSNRCRRRRASGRRAPD